MVLQTDTMQEQRFQIIEFEVAKKDDVLKVLSNNDLDKLYKKLHAVGIEINTSEIALRNSKLGLTVGNIELTNEYFPAGKFYGNFGVEPNKRYFFPEYPIEAKGNRAEIVFTDGGNATAYPYSVKMIFWLKNE